MRPRAGWTDMEHRASWPVPRGEVKGLIQTFTSMLERDDLGEWA